MKNLLLGRVIFLSLVSSGAQYAETIDDYNGIIVDYDSDPLPNLPIAIISDPILIPPGVRYEEKTRKESLKKRWAIKPSIPTLDERPIEQVLPSIYDKKAIETVYPKKEDLDGHLKPAIPTTDHQEFIETAVDNIRTDIEYWPEKRKPPKFVRDYKYRFGNGKGVGIGHRYKDGKYLGKGYVGLPQKETNEC